MFFLFLLAAHFRRGQYVLSHWLCRKSTPTLPVLLITDFLSREEARLSERWCSHSLSTEKVRRCGVMDWNEALPLNCCYCGCHLALISLRNWTWAAVCTGSGIRRCWFLHVFPIKLCGYKVTSPLARLHGVALFRPGAVWAGNLPLAGKRTCCADVFTVW